MLFPLAAAQTRVSVCRLGPNVRHGDHITARRYARLVDRWVQLVDLEPGAYGTHSLRRTKVALVFKKTGNLRACQLLLETTTYCPRTPARRSDLLSVPSPVRRDRADQPAVRLSRH
jgi:hypothetical protein